MELNTKDKTLRYSVKETDQGIAFKNISFNTNAQFLAISLT